LGNAIFAQNKALICAQTEIMEELGWLPLHCNNDTMTTNKMLIKNGFAKQNISFLTGKLLTKQSFVYQLQLLSYNAYIGATVYIHFLGFGT